MGYDKKINFLNKLFKVSVVLFSLLFVVFLIKAFNTKTEYGRLIFYIPYVQMISSLPF